MVLGLSSKMLVIIVVLILLAVYVAGVSVGVRVDSTAPQILIKSPTKNSTFVTNAATVIVSGSAYDDVAVKGMVWSNNATGSEGNCTGSADMTSWQTGSISLDVGKNRIDLKIWDRAGNPSYANITVYLDITPPNCTITGPTKDSDYRTYAKNMSLAGKAFDYGNYPGLDIVSVEWENAANTGSGTASLGLDNTWSVGKIELVVGENVITVTVKDAAGNYGEDQITVTRVA